MAQVCGFPVPLHGIRIVLLRARTGFKRQASLELGRAVARFRFAQKFDQMTGSLGRPLKNYIHLACWGRKTGNTQGQAENEKAEHAHEPPQWSER